MAISNNSTGLRTGVCTSTTRPTAPYEGQHIYETDTDIEYVWNGTAWVVNYVSANSPAFTGTPTAPTASAGTNTTQIATMASKPWNVPWGIVAGVRSSGAHTTPTDTTPVEFVRTSNFTPVAGRVYRVSWAVGYFIKHLSTNNQEIKIREGSPTSTNIIDAVLYSAVPVGYWGSPAKTTYITTTTLGTTSSTFICMTVETNGTNSAATFSSGAGNLTLILVEDIGPA